MIPTHTNLIVSPSHVNTATEGSETVFIYIKSRNLSPLCSFSPAPTPAQAASTCLDTSAQHRVETLHLATLMNIFSGHFWLFSVCRNQEIINDQTLCWWYSWSWFHGAGSYFHNLTALSCGHLHNPVLLSSTHHGTVSAVAVSRLTVASSDTRQHRVFFILCINGIMPS